MPEIDDPEDDAFREALQELEGCVWGQAQDIERENFALRERNQFHVDNAREKLLEIWNRNRLPKKV